MSILLQTSFGDLTVDLFVAKCPTASKNFLKLCKMKHYNNAIFSNVQKNYIAKVSTGRPTTIYKEVYGEEDYQYFEDQIDLQQKINKIGMLCTANAGPNLNNSEFFITLSNDNLTSLNGKHTVFGLVQQGSEVLRKISDSFTDKNQRPLMNIRILHTHIIDDPFQDLEGMRKSYPSPELKPDPERLEMTEHLEMLSKGKTEEDIVKATREQKAKKQAVTLQILGELPDADVKPPENVLFVCRLNPVTEERDLQLIFSRFGPVKSCQIVRDWKTGQSLQYGFIEYQNSKCCEEAYLKMENVLIDDRRIHVDFCQSVAKLWPRNKKNSQTQAKKSGPESKPKELVSKYKDPKDYYGQNSTKYSLLLKNKSEVTQVKREKSKSPEKIQRQTTRKQEPTRRHSSYSDESDRHKRRRDSEHRDRSRKVDRSRSRDKKDKKQKKDKKDKRDKKSKKQKKEKKDRKQKQRKRKYSSSDSDNSD